MRNVLILFLFTFLFCFNTAGSYSDEIGFGLGMSMVSGTENASGLEGENVSDPESASLSPISANIYWKVLPMEGKSVYLTATTPMVMISSGDNYFSFGSGFEFYFSEGAHRITIDQPGLKARLTPKMRFFAMAELGLGYISYTTDTAKKNDTFFEAGGGAGMAYTITDNFSLRAVGGAAFGAGVLTSSMIIKFFIGGTYYLSD